MSRAEMRTELSSAVRRRVAWVQAGSADSLCRQPAEYAHGVVETTTIVTRRRDVQPRMVHEATVGGKKHAGGGGDPMARQRLAVQRQRVNALRQFHLQEVAAFRARDAGAGGEVTLDQAQGALALALARQGFAQASQRPRRRGHRRPAYFRARLVGQRRGGGQHIAGPACALTVAGH
jgi:hypothetical protein